MRHFTLLLAAAAVGCATTSASINSLDHVDSRIARRLDAEPAPTWLPVPVAGVRVRQLRDSWGEARSGGRAHEGIDIMASRGTPVLSTTHGVVSSVQERGLGGKSVTVRGPGGQSHYYAHLDGYGRHFDGDWVAVGDTLGFVGTTGNAQGGAPHLHYGIHTEHGAINPYPLLTARGDQDQASRSGSSTGTKSKDDGRSKETTSRPSRRTRADEPGNGQPAARAPETPRTATASRRR